MLRPTGEAGSASAVVFSLPAAGGGLRRAAGHPGTASDLMRPPIVIALALLLVAILGAALIQFLVMAR